MTPQIERITVNIFPKSTVPSLTMADNLTYTFPLYIVYLAITEYKITHTK